MLIGNALESLHLLLLNAELTENVNTLRNVSEGGVGLSADLIALLDISATMDNVSLRATAKMIMIAHPMKSALTIFVLCQC